MIGGFCQAGGVSANERAGDRAGRPMGEGPERGWRSIGGETCFASGASSCLPWAEMYLPQMHNPKMLTLTHFYQFLSTF